MPAHTNPTTPCRNDQRVIHAQRDEGSSPHSSQTDDLCAIGAPGKVFGPDLSTRIEKWYSLTGQWIFGVSAAPFELVAATACQTEIGEDCLPSFRLRQDVVNGRRNDRIGPGSLAVTTAMMALRSQFLPQTDGGAALAHPASRSDSGGGT